METSRRGNSSGAVVLLVLAAVVGVLTVLFTYGFLAEYGPTGGSWRAGAAQGIKTAAIPLVPIAAMAVAAFVLAGSRVWLQSLAVSVVLLTGGAAVVVGGMAVQDKYDRMPALPYCATAGFGTEGFSGPEADAINKIRQAYTEMDHPGRFYGGGSSGPAGCSSALTVSFGQAAPHYRQELSANGWQITRETSSELVGQRDDLVFVAREDRCGMVTVAIGFGEMTGSPDMCE